MNLITGTKKRNLALKRLDEEDEDDEDPDGVEKDNGVEKDKSKAVTESVSQKIVAKAKKTQKVVAPKTYNGNTDLVKCDEIPDGTASEGVVPPEKKIPTSPGRSSQRSPRSPARLIHEKQDIRVTQLVTSGDNDTLPNEVPQPLRENVKT